MKYEFSLKLFITLIFEILSMKKIINMINANNIFCFLKIKFFISSISYEDFIYFISEVASSHLKHLS